MLRPNNISDRHCQGLSFEVIDVDGLAEAIASVLVQEFVLARQIVTGVTTGAFPSLNSEEVEDIVSRRLNPTDIYHRDGFIFQIIMWLASYLDLEDGDLVSLPHSQPSNKGQDSIVVHRDSDSNISLSICEDKATENPRKTIREEVWPEIKIYEEGKRRDELKSNIIATLGTGGIPVGEATELIRKICWANAYRYRARVTVEPSGRKADLFKGFSDVVAGDAYRRRGETLEVPSLRIWMTNLSGKIEQALRRRIA